MESGVYTWVELRCIMLAPVFSAAGMSVAPLLAATAVLCVSIEAVRQIVVGDEYHEAAKKWAVSQSQSGMSDVGSRKSPL